MLTEEERRQELVDLWTKCTSEVSEAVEEHFDSKNNLAIHRTVRCTRKHDADQPDRRYARLGGKPEGEIIPRPVKSNYRKGLSVLEYFISQHARVRVWPIPHCVPQSLAT